MKIECIIKLIAKNMKQKDISAAQLSKKTGISKSCISRYLSGETKPSYENLIKMTDAVGLKIVVVDEKDILTAEEIRKEQIESKPHNKLSLIRRIFG